MTALHWLAYNNDRKAIDAMLYNKGTPVNHMVWTHDDLMPVDIAGTVPSYAALDAFLEHYSTVNNLHKPQAFHNTDDVIEEIMAKQEMNLAISQKTDTRGFAKGASLFEGSKSLKDSLPAISQKSMTGESRDMFREMDGNNQLDSGRLELSGRN